MSGQWWLFPDHGAVYADEVMSDDGKELAHPVVVIDPEDEGDVDRIANALREHGDEHIKTCLDWLGVQAALRELATPTAQPESDQEVLARVRALREKWQHEVTYGVWNRRAEYEHRLAQLDHALTPPTEGPQP